MLGEIDFCVGEYPLGDWYEEVPAMDLIEQIEEAITKGGLTLSRLPSGTRAEIERFVPLRVIAGGIHQVIDYLSMAL